MQAIPIMGIKAILVALFMFKFQIMKTGRIAKVKSQMILQAEYRYVSALMISMGTQVPPLGFVTFIQKKGSGLHCSSVTKKKTTPVRTVTAITL